MLLWEDFRLSTKIRMFQRIKLPQELAGLQERLVKDLEKVSSARNRYAHRLSLVRLADAYLIDKGHKPYKVDEKTFSEFKEMAMETLAGLRMILLKQQGLAVSGPSKMMWIPTDQINGMWDENGQKKSSKS